MDCKYIFNEFKNVPQINKVQFLNSGGAKTKVLNINNDNIDYFISLLHDLKEEIKKNS